ncbi:MAG TPA: carboxylesterase/lipase family protein [bacterium]|nr:carboxylesterase/lipase family protein [bacterium]
MKKIIAVMVFSLLAAAMPARAMESCSDPVRIASGLVRGMAHPETGVCEWLGVPYAAPPVGELRWRAPAPIPAWEGVRETIAYGDRCMQKASSGLSKVRRLDGMSEDCLYLNVYRPKKSGPFPVMVWIHGGGYVIGSGQGYRGDRLAEFGDVVVVTINYRLGVFGYLALPSLRAEDGNKSAGSYGSLDQVAALRWVHDNIAAFGGDPGNVTVFGESAGGWAVCTMLATPLARGLFSRAIMESQGCEASESMETGYEKAQKIAASVGCGADDLACLRGLDALKLLNEGQQSILPNGISYFPHHDGYLLADTPLSLIRSGSYNRVPFLAGSTRDEVDFMIKLLPDLNNTMPAQYAKRMEKTLGFSADEVTAALELYPLSAYDGRPGKAFGKMFTDASIACPTCLGVQAVAEQQTDVYYYRFDYDEMRLGKMIGALHSMEIPFVFGSLDGSGYGRLYNRRNIGPAQELSRVVMGYWTNFAKTGDPNGPGLPEWPRYDTSTRNLLVLDTNIHIEQAGVDARCAFWEEYGHNHPPFVETLGRPDNNAVDK